MKNSISTLHNIPQIGFGPGLGFTHFPPMPSSRMDRFVRKIKKRFSPHRYNEEIAQWHEKVYVDAIASAFKQGFRLLDYSAAYGDGILVGEGLKASGVKRDELIITTRVSNKAQYDGRVSEEIIQQIKNLGVDYVDILQFHWPVTGFYLDTWREMEKLVDKGYVKCLGVANCHQHHLKDIFKICKYRPVIGQFEIHPLFSQKELIKFYHEEGIAVEAYTPIARYDDRLVRLPLIKQLESKYNKTFVQIILRWHIQNNCIPLVRCLSKEHQKENLSIFDFELTDEDMCRIDSININSRLRYDPDNCDFTIL